MSPGNRRRSQAKAASAPGMITMSEALMEFLTLRIATRWDDTREKAKGSTENLAICSALLLTMVSISGEGRLGEEMKGFMDYETALQTYSVLGTLSLSGFFVATTTAIFTLVYITYLDSDEALRMWIEHCGYFVKLSFFSFFAGMFFYIVMVLLEFFTIIGPSSGFLWSLPGFTLLTRVTRMMNVESLQQWQLRMLPTVLQERFYIPIWLCQYFTGRDP